MCQHIIFPREKCQDETLTPVPVGMKYNLLHHRTNNNIWMRFFDNMLFQNVIVFVVWRAIAGGPTEILDLS